MICSRHGAGSSNYTPVNLVELGAQFISGSITAQKKPDELPVGSFKSGLTERAGVNLWKDL